MMSKAERINLFRMTSLCYLKNEDGRNLITWLDKIGFFTAPASTKFHGAYEGGLFDHSYAMFLELIRLTDNGRKWKRSCSPFLVSMLHDICKCDQYKQTESGYEYRKDTLLTGHADKSLIRLLEAPIRLNEEEIICIRYHMGAFTDEKQWSDYTNAIRTYPNVLWTHTADMVASHVKGV